MAITRFASHRVLMADGGNVLSRQVIELDDRHFVTAVFPFEREIDHTIWLDGLIVVSCSEILSTIEGETLNHYISRLAAMQTPHGSIAGKRPLAYHIADFDALSMTLTSNSHPRLL